MNAIQKFQEFELSENTELFFEAKKMFEAEKIEESDNTEMLALYAYLHDNMAQKCENLALGYYLKAIELDMKNNQTSTDQFFHTHKQMILLETRIGRIHKSIDRYKNMLLEKPDDLRVYECLIMAYKGAYQPDDALSTIKAGLKINPNSADMYQQEGEVYWQIGELENALNSTEKSISIQPNGNTMRTKAVLLKLMGKKQEYIKAWEAWADYSDSRGLNEFADNLRKSSGYLFVKSELK
jgi:tetratricopeptide (TPR) repeat protein